MSRLLSKASREIKGHIGSRYIRKTKQMTGKLTALGLMSGTSLDGVDIAVLHSDGARHIQPGPDGFYPYDTTTKQALRNVLDSAADLPTAVLADMALWPDALIAADNLVTQAHYAAIDDFLSRHDGPVDLIGFHGQTIIHRPEEGFTLQIGDGQALAQLTGRPVVARFRHADMAAGGQGAPLAPLFHAALLDDAGDDACAVVNLGGVANLTYIGQQDEISAFDCGPANALIDDWVMQKTGQAYDADGALAARGMVDEEVVTKLMAHSYFAAPPPKSLDRLSFSAAPVAGLSAEDGAATLTAFTAAGLAAAMSHCPQPPKRLILCGGGRHNATMRAMIAARCGVEVVDCDALGWRGDALEAQLFAWLAIRSLYGLPLSLPETTGVHAPISGGDLFRP